MSEYLLEPLRAEGATHDRMGFACGEEALDRYFATVATQDRRRGYAYVVVATRTGEAAVRGYYTLSAASVDLGGLPEDVRRKMPRYGQVPAVLLGRLAVDRTEQGKGLGALLLADAVKRALRGEVTWAVFLVRAKHERAAAFYRHFGFTPFAHDPLLLWLARRHAERLSPDQPSH